MSYLIIAFFFSLPFERIPTWEVAGFTVKISYILGIATLIYGFWNAKKLLRAAAFSASDRALLAFGAIAVITTLIHTPAARNIAICAMWLFMVALYLILSRLIVKPAMRELIEDAILISATLVSLFGAYQFLGDTWGLANSATGLRAAYSKEVLGFPRIQSVALEPLYFASYLLVPTYLALRRYLTHKKTVNGYWPLIVLMLANIILGSARSAFIGIGATLLVLLFWMWQKRYRRRALAILGAIIIAIVISVGMLRLNGPKIFSQNFLDHTVAQDETTGGSVYGRIDGYRKAWKFFLQKPILGHGAGSFGNLTKAPDDASSNYGIVNNEYLEILTETGTLGGLAFLTFLVLLLKETYAIYKNADATNQKIAIVTLTLGMVAIFIQYNFFSTLYIVYIWAYLALLKSYIIRSNSSQ